MPKKTYRVVYRRAKSHRRTTEHTAPHSILATILGILAAAAPFAGEPIMYMQELAGSAEAGNQQGMVSAAGGLVESFPSAAVANAGPMIGLAIAAIVVGWAGRKYGKSYTNVSKKWRVI